MTTDNDERLVYGVFPGAISLTELIFVPEDQAYDLAQVHRALRGADAWGDVKATISARHWQELVDTYRDEVPPADNDPFDSDALPGYGAGDWPEWPAQEMLFWMPDDIQERYGEVATSTLNGEFLIIPARSEDELVAALEAAGFQCTRDDQSVSRASGW